MSNRNIYRENQKNRLKRQIVGEAAQNAPEYDYGSRFPARKVLPAAAIVLFLLFAVGWFYLTNRHYESLDVLWENQISAESGQTDTFRGYERFAKGIIRYSKDGAAYIDHDGKTVWERSYQMQNPIVSASGDYAAIADRGAQSIYIFSDSANTGVAATVLPVTRITISEGGIVYATLRDEEADYITAFRQDGSGIDLSIKSIITGDGYPLDIDISPDGTELITSYVAIENGQAVPKVIFRNFGEVGKADARRVVGGFTAEFAGHIVGRVHFSSNEYSQAFYDGGIAFFSTKVLTSPELLKNEVFEETINSIAYSDKYVAVVLNTNEGELPYRLLVYKADGTKLSDTAFSFPYTELAIDGNEILLYNDQACRVYTPQGNERIAADFPVQVSIMAKEGLPGEYLLCGSGRLMKVRMQ